MFLHYFIRSKRITVTISMMFIHCRSYRQTKIFLLYESVLCESVYEDLLHMNFGNGISFGFDIYCRTIRGNTYNINVISF